MKNERSSRLSRKSEIVVVGSSNPASVTKCFFNRESNRKNALTCHGHFPKVDFSPPTTLA